MGTGLISGGSGHATIAVGDFTVTMVLDGTLHRRPPHTTFGTDQPPEAVATLLRENHLPEDGFVHCFVPVIVRTGTETVLFDTGFGEGGRGMGAGRLLERMQAAGIAPGDISVIVMTHMHPDHTGGLMEGGAPAFPNARILASKIEYDFFTDDARIGTPAEGSANAVRKNLVPMADRITFFADGDEVLPGITAIWAPGHTPGHTAFMLESAGIRLMLAADTANHYLLSMGRPDWHVVFDGDKVKAAESRHRIFGMLADEGIPFIGYHMPFPSVAYAERTEHGFRYVPATYQFDMPKG